MNRTAFFLSLLLTVGMLEWTDAPLKRAIAHESGNHTESSHPQAHETGTRTSLFNNLGKHYHPTSTKNSLAQRYFNQGLILTYGFNHAEAISQ